jgi:hypothetical protein
VSEEPHVEKPAEPELWTPEPTMNGPTRARQIVGRPAPPHFHDSNFVAFLGQSMCGNTTTKAGPNDDEIKVELAVTGCHGWLRFVIKNGPELLPSKKPIRWSRHHTGSNANLKSRSREYAGISERIGRSGDGSPTNVDMARWEDRHHPSNTWPAAA